MVAIGVSEGATYMSTEEKIKSLGIALPEVKAIGNYVPAKMVGNEIAGYFIFMSGQIPLTEGKAEKNFTVNQMQDMARICTLKLISAMKDAGANLDTIEIVKVGVFVNCNSGFGKQPEVANGASNLLVEIFGERGKHARAAVGSNDLPRENSIEIEMIAYQPAAPTPNLFDVMSNVF